MITEEQIQQAANDHSNAVCSMEGDYSNAGGWRASFRSGVRWALEQLRWIKGFPDNCGTYIFIISFMHAKNPVNQMLIGSISEDTGELLDHDGQPTGWDDAKEVITHYMPLPGAPKTDSNGIHLPG